MGGGKAEFGTPKYVANKMKAKGLQKLRWYCQMCQKQCRDENGFKCHTMSESHQRQLLLFADNPGRYIYSFSYEFSKGYLDILKRQFGTKRVNANKVYQEYISHKDHIHMNSTRWCTLTDYVKYLGREGHCVVDETEKGWYVQYIERDPVALARQEAQARREKVEKDDEERHLEFIGKQVEKAAKAGKSVEPQYTELLRDNEEEKITVKLKTNKIEAKPILSIPTSQLLDKRKSDDVRSVKSEPPFKKPKDKESTRKSMAMAQIIEEEMKKKKYREAKQAEGKNSRDEEPNWLHENIVVKIVTETLGEKYHKKKGVVLKVIDKYGAEVMMLDSKDKLKLDQDHLETVIPGIGRAVRVVLGKFQGKKGELLNLKDGGCLVKLDDDEHILQYHQVCKIHDK